MKRCIINVAVGGWYPLGQHRLEESLRTHQFKGDFLSWSSYPKGSPTQAECPYAFKSYAFNEARQAGYETILWLDASCWAIRPVEPLFDYIEEAGHCFSHERSPQGQSWYAGQWLKDEALVILGVTRDEALKIELLGGMFLGLCLRHETAQNWLDEFVRICQDGVTLPGPLHNVNGCVSKDPRCLGHTHDQSVASVIAHKLGMALTYPPRWRDWYKARPDPSTVIAAMGM